MLFGWDGLAMGMMESVKQYNNIWLYMQVPCPGYVYVRTIMRGNYFTSQAMTFHSAITATMIRPRISRSRWWRMGLNNLPLAVSLQCRPCSHLAFLLSLKAV